MENQLISSSKNLSDGFDFLKKTSRVPLQEDFKMKKYVFTLVLSLVCFFSVFGDEPLSTKIIPIEGLTPQQNFAVLKAAFGTKEKHYDVTRKIKEALDANQLNIRAETAIFGDPTPAFAKILEVVYTVNNKLKAVSVNENEILDFSLLK